MMWVFINKTTGNILECSELEYLIQNALPAKGLNLDSGIMADLIIYGNTEFTVEVNNVINDIRIYERK